MQLKLRSDRRLMTCIALICSKRKGVDLNFFHASWWRLPESNGGHTDFQSVALPTELRRQMILPANFGQKYKNFLPPAQLVFGHKGSHYLILFAKWQGSPKFQQMKKIRDSERNCIPGIERKWSHFSRFRARPAAGSGCSARKRLALLWESLPSPETRLAALCSVEKQSGQ